MKKRYSKAALFLASQAVTLLGSSIVQFAIIWYVTLETSSGGWVALLSAAAYIPQFLISFFAGVWADRYPRKRLIITADGAIAIATLALVLLLPQISRNETIYTALVVISAIRSLGTGIHTPAVNATVPQLVAEEHLMKFNGINATVQSVVQFAAPAIAGSILTWGSFRGALMVDVVTAMVGIGLLGTIAIPFEKRTETAPVFAEMQEGIRYAVKERFLGKLIMLFGLFIFLCVPAGFLATLFVSRYYGDTHFHMTLVEVIGFLGMMAGGLLIGTWGGSKRQYQDAVGGNDGLWTAGHPHGSGKQLLCVPCSDGRLRSCADHGADSIYHPPAEEQHTGNVGTDLWLVRRGLFQLPAHGYGRIRSAGRQNIHAIADGGLRWLADLNGHSDVFG